MSNFLPPDHDQRLHALHPEHSLLVQAPAGSGKTDLLTRRFLRLLAQVEDPAQIVAITFTRAAAAEMRHRILSELEKAAAAPPVEPAPQADGDDISMQTLAARALAHSRHFGWQLLDVPSQLRISTIDSFCREIALQQPLLTGLGGRLDIHPQPAELYHRAARRTLQQLDSANAALASALRELLLWHDNNWQQMEDLLVDMLERRDRWMHDFVLDRDPNWDALRLRLEQPFTNAARDHITLLSNLLQQIPHATDELLGLARFACQQPNGEAYQPLAELADFPSAPFDSLEAIEAAHQAWLAVADLLLINAGTFRQQINKSAGFPADRKPEKARLLALIAQLQEILGLQSALAQVRTLPPVRYTPEDWHIVRACFTLLHHAAGQLLTVFAETGMVDYVQVAQIAQQVLRDPDGQPSDAAIALADGIRHLLVDEFQDTSRRQHRLLASLVAAWPDPYGRTAFVVGDPMQSIYFFRDADAELFARVRDLGLDLPGADPFRFRSVSLSANFRTDPSLVTDLNHIFTLVFAQDEGSGVTFSTAEPAREPNPAPPPRRHLHPAFMPQSAHSALTREHAQQLRLAAQQAQTDRIVSLLQSQLPLVQHARDNGSKHRIAVLARVKRHLAPIAAALRQAGIPFRAVELEDLSSRPEVLDALALARALFHPQDRVAWLGVLRAPWCGLSLADIHLIAGDAAEATRPIPALLAERLASLSLPGQAAAQRLLRVLQDAPTLRDAQPLATLGTWLQQVWLRLGGAACVDAAALANLDLLWRCLDSLPAGELDLLGPALATALKKLTALPDPESSTDSGIQLMTIHKSKGLEFEVVLVPELQARTARGLSSRRLFAWLERGLARPDPSGEVTEFLVAPLQSRGADRSSAKAWVDRAIRDRESQEMRRLLYVAATRAREELHLFARPEYKLEDGTPQLSEPKDSLLATAWPAFAPEVQVQFDDWQQEPETQTLFADPSTTNQTVANLTAAEDAAIAAPPPTLLRRLPANFAPPALAAPVSGADGLPPLSAPRLFERHEGGLESRVLGTAVHSLLEQLARLRSTLDEPAALDALSSLLPRIVAQVRAAGFAPAQAVSLAANALQIVTGSASDPIARWILSPHPDAAAEAAWTGILAGSLRTVRVDRVFRAGPEPLAPGDSVWWIIDYKTIHPDAPNPAQALPALRSLFAPQLEAYAVVLRHLHGASAQFHAALYYPRLAQFDWWLVS